MDKEELIKKNEDTERELKSVIDKLKANVELFLNKITPLHCLLLSNVKRLILENAEQCIGNIFDIAEKVNREFENYIKLENEYVEEATSLIAAYDYDVPIIKLEIPEVFSKMPTISKIINSIKNRKLFSDDYVINRLYEKDRNKLENDLKIIYKNFSTLLSGEELHIISPKIKIGKEFTEDNIEELTPSETDYKKANKDFGLYKEIIESDDYSIPFEPDDSEEASTGIDGFPDEVLAAEEAPFDETKDTHNAEPEIVGGAPLINEAAIEGLDTEDDKVVVYSDKDETKPERKTSSTKKAPTKKKPLTKTGSAVRTIPKQKSDMLLLKINGIYKEVERIFFEKELEINEDNYFNILKELCENQSEKQNYKIKVINGKYYLTKQIGGNEVTMTLNYEPFLTHIQSNFDDKIKIMGYRSNLNLKGFEPEKVNTAKATIYTCLNISPLGKNFTSLIISAYMLKRLADLGARSLVSYSSTNDKKGYKSAMELNFAEIDGDKDKDLSIPLSNIDKNKPINISIFLESGKKISLKLIRVNKEPEILEEKRTVKL